MSCPIGKKVRTVMAVITLSLPAPLFAGGVTVYQEDGAFVKIGGRIQMQYHKNDPDDGADSDTVFLRRLRPFIEGSLHKDWKGKFQFDLGKANNENEISIKDAYMEYTGFDGIKIKIGNASFPFSRELLSSSKKQQLVERTFVGNHNYGTPSRNLGIHVSGHNTDKKITWGAAISQAAIDPSSSKLDFDSPVNAKDDFNEGWIFGGRVDFHPFGRLKFSQGDFKGDMKATIGLAAFTWSNDGDFEDKTAGSNDISDVTGFELSGAFRANGFSVDTQYNRFSADTSDVIRTSGLYENGSTDLESRAVEGGYMVMPGKLELVLGYQLQDADNYAEEWARTSVGINWFIHQHDIKLQTSYRLNDNMKGVKGNDENELFVQAQYVF
ncbi:MAG: porin [Gammaproteobacteria bacterium]